MTSRNAGFTLFSAMAAALLASCGGQAQVASTGPVHRTPDGAGGTSAKPATDGVAAAEARVAKSPRDGALRVDLAQAYLAQGRFNAAATTLEDAMALGEASPRTGLGLALAYIGSGRNAEALDVLGKWRDQLPASDYGLALALAGQPSQGVSILTDAVRGGESNAKTRQNLAYAYALDGRWTEARVVAAQDLPADQIDARLAEWGSRALPQQGQARIAGLLGTPVRSDPGQPAALALNDVPHAAQTALAVAAPAPAGELAPLDETDVSPAVQPVVSAAALAVAEPAAPAPVPSGDAFVHQPRVQPVPVATRTFADTFGEVGARAHASGKGHLVQLGSFSTREGAERAWGIFQARDRSLRNHSLRITEAEVRGRRYFRVAAEGFDRSGAQVMCGTVKRRGDGCFAYAESHPLPGALPARREEAARFAQR